MPKSKHRKKPHGLAGSMRSGSPASPAAVRLSGADVALLKQFVAALEAIDPDHEKHSAIRRQRFETCVVPYGDTLGDGQDFLLDMIVAASVEGGLEVPLSKVTCEFGDDPTMTPARVEELLGNLARAGIIGWEPGATMVELRPRERQE